MESIKIEIRNGVTVEIAGEVVDEIVRNYITSTMNVSPMVTPVQPKAKRRRFEAILGRRKWTETETDTIKKEFNNQARSRSSKSLGKLLNRTPGAIIQKAIELRLV
jgi:hypothetical protein